MGQPILSPRQFPDTSRRWTRRQLLRGAGGLGAGAAVATRSGSAGAVSSPGSVARPNARQSGDDATLTIATNRAPSDLDPHSAYDLGSIVVHKGPFETLIGLVP